MKQVLVLLMSLVIASPSYAQMSFGPPSGQSQAKPQTQQKVDPFKNKSDPFKKNRLEDGKGRELKNGWFLYRNSGKNACQIAKAWGHNPNAKTDVWAKNYVTRMTAYKDGSFAMSIAGHGGNWAVTPGQTYSGAIKFYDRYGGWVNWTFKEAKGQKDFPGIVVHNLIEGILKDFAGKSYMEWSIEGLKIGVYNLKGSRHALKQLKQCKESL